MSVVLHLGCDEDYNSFEKPSNLKRRRTTHVFTQNDITKMVKQVEEEERDAFFWSTLTLSNNCADSWYE
jgi:hypothetical protein